MNNRSMLLVRIASVAAALTCGAASAQSGSPVSWDADAAIAMGSACTSRGDAADTFFIAAGEDVSVIFTDFGIDLNESDSTSAAVHSCLVASRFRSRETSPLPS